MPKVSVIIPVYNREDFIRPVIESVLNQTFQDFEIIVVDDKSTDRTREIVRKMQVNDKRIRLIELEKNSGGPALPTNIGIKNAKGDFIAILESDDLYLPNFLEIRLKHLEKNNLDWTIGGAFYVFFKNLKFNKYVKGSSVSTWVLRKNVFEKIGYFQEEENIFQDLGISLRAIKSGKIKTQFLPTPLTLCFIHPESYTFFLHKPREKAIIFIERLKPLLKHASGMKSWESLIYWKLGNYYCLAGEMKKGRNYFKESFRTNPNLNSLLLYFLSFLGKTLYYFVWKILWLTKNIFLEKIKLPFYIAFKYHKEYKETQAILNYFKTINTESSLHEKN